MINGSLPDARDDIGRYSVHRLRRESKATRWFAAPMKSISCAYPVVISLGPKSVIYSTKLKKNV